MSGLGSTRITWDTILEELKQLNYFNWGPPVDSIADQIYIDISDGG